MKLKMGYRKHKATDIRHEYLKRVYTQKLITVEKETEEC